MKVCFEFPHKLDKKRAYAKEPIAVSDTSKQDEPLMCSIHPKETLKYACLNYGVLIYRNCMNIGGHKGHMSERPQEAFSKWSVKFKERDMNTIPTKEQISQ